MVDYFFVYYTSIIKPGIKFGVYSLLFLTLQSCSQSSIIVPQDDTVTLAIENTGSFSNRPYILSPEDIHQLTPEQTEDFMAYMNLPQFQHTPRHRRLYAYLENITRNYNFTNETFTAADTLRLKAGNCLSLAILTTAFARLVDIETDYQLMDTIPIYEFNNSVVNRVVHVRSIIYDPDWVPEANVFVFSKPGIKIDYFPTGKQRFRANMDENDYLAMYYQNISAEFIGQGNINSAYWHAIEALQLIPYDTQTINMLAVINRRADNFETAEQLYLFGIENANDKLSLLKNYRILLASLGRSEEAEAIDRRLNNMEDLNPFNWLQLADSFYDKGEFYQAIRYFNKAIELAPYLHEAHLGIAQANYSIGRFGRAETALQAAVDNAVINSTRALYQAKLMSLSSEQHR